TALRAFGSDVARSLLSIIAMKLLLLGIRGQPDLFSLPCFFAYRSPILNTISPIGIENTPITSNGHTSSQASPAPSRIELRQPRSAWGAGDISAIHCIHWGSSSTG